MSYVRKPGLTGERYQKGMPSQPGPGQEGIRPQKGKPDAPPTGADGNIFNLIGIASHALEGAGMQEEAEGMYRRVLASGSYQEALDIISGYVNFTEA